MSPFSLGILGSARVAPASGGVVSDNFNRADGALNGSTSTSGHTWTAHANWSVTSNKATTTATVESHNATIAGFSDVEVSAVITGPASYPGLLARFVDGNNNYRVIFNPGNSRWELRRLIAGTDTVLDSYTGDTPTTATTVLLRVVEGANTGILVNIAGNDRIVYNDSTSGRPNGTAVGMHKGWKVAGDSSTFDDFTATEL